MTPMSCDRAAELLSDDLEGALDGVLAADLAGHLGSCPECRALRAAMGDVTALLRTPEVGPAADLAARVARASFAARPRPLRRPRRAWAAAGGGWLGWLGEVPFAVQAVAASLALVMTAGLVMAAGSPPGTPARPRLAQRASDGLAHVMERKDRLVEDLRLLRVVVVTAFEGRLDRVNDRVDDYRRLLERRQREEQARDPKKTQAGVGAPRWAAARGSREFRTRADAVS